jgi:hypothetical protein
MQSGWLLCRNLQEIAVPNADVLPRWAERGRLRPDDYLVNPRLELCVQAKDVPDLKAIFRKQRMRYLEPARRLIDGAHHFFEQIAKSVIQFQLGSGVGEDCHAVADRLRRG